MYTLDNLNSQTRINHFYLSQDLSSTVCKEELIKKIKYIII